MIANIRAADNKHAIARPSHLRRLRPSDIALLPVNLRRYLEHTTQSLRRRAGEDPGACLR